ncbi:class I SAM-dependent methyltransferase [Streptomyces sp. WAC 04229]|uniref:class I SAM-dependent methyltransferase n=1 Tax=Streptomyces sp. WAC 04229 TaxID=2203206 RepID=UPI000F7428BA|nr:class I SAM-dependent methyltransferase [Streptomyces sp. WAC 04229]
MTVQSVVGDAEIEAVAATHPQVERAVVSDGVIQVMPADAAPQTEFVAQWRRLYDDLYAGDSDDSGTGSSGSASRGASDGGPDGGAASAGGPMSDFSGWTSSYTGDLIPAEQMEEWRAATVERIRGLHPSRVLEIGVGSGLLLWHLAPDCAEYRATDFSPVTIANLRARLRSSGVPWASRVHLRAAEAVETDRFPEGYFDTVIINSVTMHFPGHGYMRRVVEQALRVLAPGGRLFIGDNRNLSLLPEFVTEIQRTQHPSAAPAELRDRVDEAVAGHEWLLLAPEYFVATARELPDVAGVDIQLKRGSQVNELTSFRFDVVLHKGPAPVRSLTGVPRLPFAGRPELTAELRRRPGEDLRVTGIPNRALLRLLASAAAVRRGEEPPPAQEEAGLLPEDLHLLAEQLGRRVVVTGSAQPGEMDAVFLSAPEEEPLTDLYDPVEPLKSASCHVNYPQAAELAEHVRRFVAERLPGSDVPAVEIVNAFPRTTDGLRNLEELNGSRS